MADSKKEEVVVNQVEKHFEELGAKAEKTGKNVIISLDKTVWIVITKDSVCGHLKKGLVLEVSETAYEIHKASGICEKTDNPNA
jgi:hypothetical protein